MRASSGFGVGISVFWISLKPSIGSVLMRVFIFGENDVCQRRVGECDPECLNIITE